MEREGQREVKQFRKRERSLTEHDIEDILEAFERRSTMHTCRFSGVSEEDFYESVKFFKGLNESLQSGKNVVAKTILSALVLFLLGMLGAGIVSKIK